MDQGWQKIHFYAMVLLKLLLLPSVVPEGHNQLLGGGDQHLYSQWPLTGYYSQQEYHNSEVFCHVPPYRLIESPTWDFLLQSFVLGRDTCLSTHYKGMKTWILRARESTHLHFSGTLRAASYGSHLITTFDGDFSKDLWQKRHALLLGSHSHGYYDI